MSKEKDIWDMSDDKLVRLAMKTGSDFNADAVLGLGKGPLSQQGISDAVSDKYPYLAPLPASGESSSSSKGSSSSGGSSGSSGDGFSPSKSLGVGSKLYATDDYGGMDYSALLQTAPQYQPSEWDKTRDTLTKAALEMNYDDWTKGEQYAALAERYGQQGQQSMRDTLGQVSARTGGLASSYAATAAQQSYNQYMSQLEEVARQMYAGERADAIQNAQLAYQISDRNYQRYLDQLSQYNTDRSFNFGVLSDALDRSFQREQWKNTLAQQEYQKERDALSDQRYTDETAYGRGLDAYDQGVALRDDARTRIWQYLTMGGGLDGLDPALIEQSQYTPAELEAIGRYYAPQQTVGNLYTTANYVPVPSPTELTGPQKDFLNATAEDLAEEASPGVGTMKKWSDAAMLPMSKDKWEAARQEYLYSFQGPDEVAEFETYGDYRAAFDQWRKEMGG